MKRILLICIITLIGNFSAYSQSDIIYTSADSALVVKLLSEAKSQRPKESPMLYFGKKFLGVPYVAHTLEKGIQERLVVNLHELDCTTFVETVLALSLCHKDGLTSFSDFCQKLTLIRYRGGKRTDYTSRLHYFTWWGEDNEALGIVTCVDPKKEPSAADIFTGTQTVKINYMTRHPQLYKQLKAREKYVEIIRRYENKTNGKSYPYIPKTLVGKPQSSSLGVIHDGDIISMLTSKSGLDTSHIGIAVWQDGKLHCLNASAVYKKVVLDSKTFYDYQQVQTSQIGIRVYRPNL